MFSPGDAITLSGELRVPPAPSSVPAVVLLHGCGGLGNAETGWVEPLLTAGYATLVVDSLSGRGLRQICTNTFALLPTQRVSDAYAALAQLVTDPRIDRGRVALMGFSHGGITTLMAATTWARDRYARNGTTFRAFVPFYPYCNTRFPELHQMAAPVRVHVGALDDWTPAPPCHELVTLLRDDGNDAEIIEYAGAHHSFDNVGRSVVYLPDVDNGANCHIELPSIIGPLPSRSTIAACLRKGATIGWNPGATEAARKNVLAQLGTLLH